jgi:hypothetical protein
MERGTPPMFGHSVAEVHTCRIEDSLRIHHELETESTESPVVMLPQRTLAP